MRPIESNSLIFFQELCHGHVVLMKSLGKHDDFSDLYLGAGDAISPKNTVLITMLSCVCTHTRHTPALHQPAD